MQGVTMRINTRFSWIVILIFWIPVFSGNASAQALWDKLEPGSFFSFETHKPVFSEDAYHFEYSPLSSATFVNGRFHLSESFAFTADMPVAWARIEGVDPLSQEEVTESEYLVGNPFVGFQYVQSHRIFEFGARLPIVEHGTEIAEMIGIFSDLNRNEAFFPDVTTIYGRAYRNTHRTTGFRAAYHTGATVMIPDHESADAQLFFDYRADAGFDTGVFSVAGGLTGRMNLTDEFDDFSDRYTHHIHAQSTLKLGGFEPGVHFKIALDEDIRDFIHYTFGVHIQFR